MNAATPPTLPPAQTFALPDVATALLSTRPHWLVSVSTILAAINAALASILGFLSFLDWTPPQYAALAGAAAIIIVAIQRAVIAVGDLLDDGLPNNSFGRTPAIVLPLLLLIALLPACTALEGGLFTAGVTGQKYGLEYNAGISIPLGKRAAAASGKSAKDVLPVLPK